MLYLHYDRDRGYYFKAAILGACGFTIDNALKFVYEVFDNEPTVTVMKLRIPETGCNVIKDSKQTMEHLSFTVSKSKKRKAQRKRAAKNAALVEIQQGPDSEQTEQSIAPIQA